MAETIFAQASGQGRAGVSVFRISGGSALAAARALAGSLPDARQAGLRTLTDPSTGELIDEGLVLVFPAPKSFTGEDVVELHLHGSVAVGRAVQTALGRMPGIRLAAPGEFTRRALANGRLDLAQVEGLGDLVAAETAAQQRQALAILRGRVGALAQGWRSVLLQALAVIEATIDFADEELPPDILSPVAASVQDVTGAMRREIAGSPIAERLRAGFEVAIVGPPNAGKSTLLNALAGRDAALTSPTPGTTRDVIEVRMDLEGLPLTVLDTAGIRESATDIEALGIDRARVRAEAADVRVFLVDEEADADRLGIVRRAGDLVCLAKVDLRPRHRGVSGRTGAGIDGLLAALAEVLRDRLAGAGSLGHARQREAVARAAAAADGAFAELQRARPRIELAAEDLRTALRALDLLAGKVDVEAVLDSIFARFCLGK